MKSVARTAWYLELAGEMLRSALRSPTNVKGYVHPLGFSHIVLPSPDARKFRLHVWPSVPLPEFSSPPQVHNHGFRFTSLVLRGSVQHTPFQTEPASVPSENLWKVFRVMQRGIDTHLNDTGEFVRIDAGQAATYSAGSIYEFPEGAYHVSASIGEQAAITFVIAQKAPGISSYVLKAHASGLSKWRKIWLARPLVVALVEEAHSSVGALLKRGAGE